MSYVGLHSNMEMGGFSECLPSSPNSSTGALHPQGFASCGFLPPSPSFPSIPPGNLGNRASGK